MAICKDVIKNREIRFSRSGVDQAEKAMKLLSGVGGIEKMSVITPDALSIRYDVQQLTLQMLESALVQVNFKLNTGIITQIKRSLFAYCEEAQRSTLGIEQAKTGHHTLSLSEQGSHDPRPDNWRHYV
jgi:hypothetical protein